jgi:thymidylate kinase
MSFVIIEGLDRTAKSTLANMYVQKGYKLIHFSAPDKKYSESGYSGPSYLEDLIEMMVSLSGQDVVFDRSHYGELIWPYVYGRRPLLNHSDLEILREIESQNQTDYVLMHDPNVEAHWKRCLQYKEPLTRTQFDSARTMFEDMAMQYDFNKLTLEHLKDDEDKKEISTQKRGTSSEMEETVNKDIDVLSARKNKNSDLSREQLKLAEANAINEILTGRIVKKKGDYFDSIENKIRSFLNSELSLLLGTNKDDDFNFSQEEIAMLKAVAKRMREKK